MPLRLRGGRAPFVAIATFPPFQRGNLPRRRKRFICLCEEAKRRSNLPGGWVSARHILLSLVVGYFAYAQYDALFIPYRRRCRHFPRRRKRFICLCEEAKRRSNLPGGWVSVRHILFTLVVGYFANAQYDVFFLFSVILSMSSEQTCLQGFANEDIHKAQAFCKNAKR